jgi:hypothetical protein
MRCFGTFSDFRTPLSKGLFWKAKPFAIENRCPKVRKHLKMFYLCFIKRLLSHTTSDTNFGRCPKVGVDGERTVRTRNRTETLHVRVRCALFFWCCSDGRPRPSGPCFFLMSFAAFRAPPCRLIFRVRRRLKWVTFLPFSSFSKSSADTSWARAPQKAGGAPAPQKAVERAEASAGTPEPAEPIDEPATFPPHWK